MWFQLLSKFCKKLNVIKGVFSCSVRNNYFDAKSMKDLLTNDNINKVLGFLHATGFYQKL